MIVRRWVLVAAAGAVAVLGAGPPPVPAGTVPARAVGAAGPWGEAVGVPGLEALSHGRATQVVSVSCPSPGNCAAAGDYWKHGDRQGFVVDERSGRWGRAIEVPGLGALNTGGRAEVNEVSCASAGNCAAGGDYQHSGSHPFVVSERNGRWGRAIEVTGLGRAQALVLSVSCASVGNCAAAGNHWDADATQVFVVSEKDGRWGRAIGVPDLGPLKKGDDSDISAVSCGASGSCVAGGADERGQAFVVSEKDGRWGRAIEVPGLRALNRGGGAEVDAVSCPSADSCSVGGQYTDGHDDGQGFVASEKDGRWGQAIEVPGLGTLNRGGLAIVLSVSCTSPGNCAAGGWYTGASFPSQGFVASEKNGRWSQAIQVPGLAALSKGGHDTIVLSVSCASAGRCAVGGNYETRNGQQGFAAVERDGRWGSAVEVPGLRSLNTGVHAEVDEMSCASADSCTIVGNYSDPRRLHGFVTKSSATKLSLELAH